MHELAHAVCRQAAITFPGPFDRPALVIEPAAFHRGTDVEHRLGAAHRALHRRRIAQISQRILQTGPGLVGQPPDHHAHAFAGGQQAVTSTVPRPPEAPVTR